MRNGQSLTGFAIILRSGQQIRGIVTNEEFDELLDHWHSEIHDNIFKGDSHQFGENPAFKWAVRAEDIAGIHNFILTPPKQINPFALPPGASGI